MGYVNKKGRHRVGGTPRRRYCWTEPETAAAVICHPHPLYGGSMPNNVVEALEARLLTGGFFHAQIQLSWCRGSTGGYDEGDRGSAGRGGSLLPSSRSALATGYL